MTDDKDFPIAYIERSTTPDKKTGMSMVTVACPLCGKGHVHGVRQEVVKGGEKTHRLAHCLNVKPPGGYYIMAREK